MKTLKQTGEFKFIKEIAKICKNKKTLQMGIGDDAAVIVKDKDSFLLYTTDMLIEDVHFKRDQDPRGIGHKCISCSVSDIAAMGGLPEYALVSIGLPENLDIGFVKKVYAGMRRTADRFNISIIGGDTNKSDKIIISVFLSGVVKRNHLVLRSGAKKGDLIFVTGKLGGSECGRHLRFTPRVKEAQFLVKQYSLHSMIDISDGLAQDLNHILQASNAGALLYEEQIPVSRDAKSIKEAYSQGEDFELLFTAAKSCAQQMFKDWPFKKTAVLSCIGEIKDKKFGLKVKNINNKINKLKIKGYQHF
ncbi:MAG: thiamine-phosphate kinase [Candidatus Omnitrophota bacterium]